MLCAFLVRYTCLELTLLAGLFWLINDCGCFVVVMGLMCVLPAGQATVFFRSTDRRIIASVTSYEIVCATARRAPISAYFELEAQPDHRME